MREAHWREQPGSRIGANNQAQFSKQPAMVNHF
jgi:hypothetical protein